MQIQHQLTPFIWFQQGGEDAVAHCLEVPGRFHRHVSVVR